MEGRRERERERGDRLAHDSALCLHAALLGLRPVALQHLSPSLLTTVLGLSCMLPQSL